MTHERTRTEEQSKDETFVTVTEMSPAATTQSNLSECGLTLVDRLLDGLSRLVMRGRPVRSGEWYDSRVLCAHLGVGRDRRQRMQRELREQDRCIPNQGGVIALSDDMLAVLQAMQAQS